MAEFRHLALDEIDSTNSEAWRQLASGELGPLWITARRQTAGRGRSGRTWASGDGNLLATLLLQLNVSPMQAAGLSLVTGVALEAAIRGLAPDRLTDSLRLKWPNDILLADKKLAGVLIESSAEVGPDALMTIVIGAGVNLVSHPDDIGRSATDLRQHGVTTTPAILLARFASEMHAALQIFDGGIGFEQIRTNWLNRAMAVGTDLSVNTGTELLSGVFAGLDLDGALLLAAGDGALRRVTFGDVSIKPRPPPA